MWEHPEPYNRRTLPCLGLKQQGEEAAHLQAQRVGAVLRSGVCRGQALQPDTRPQNREGERKKQPYLSPLPLCSVLQVLPFG